VAVEENTLTAVEESTEQWLQLLSVGERYTLQRQEYTPPLNKSTDPGHDGRVSAQGHPMVL
jgi:hypothetical protein